MLALCSMLLGTYYAQNYVSIIGGSLVEFNIGDNNIDDEAADHIASA